MVNTLTDWHIGSWRKKTALQQAEYPDTSQLEKVLGQIAALPPLVTTFEVEELRNSLAEVAHGKRFLLQGGDCAERFSDCREEIIKNRLKILLQMSVVLIYGMQIPVLRVGRFAGQYAKPRSKPTETRNGVTLPSYRGDNINEKAFTPEARIPNPKRLLSSYTYSAIILNLVRALGERGFSGLQNVDNWSLDFATSSPFYSSYQQIIGRMRHALQFAETVSHGPLQGLGKVDFYTSHEALHLLYEESLTRKAQNGGVYNLSTHFPWIGKRTLFEDSAHVEYMRGIRNPIGIKVATDTTPSALKSLVRHLDPHNEPGRVTLITRMGVNEIERYLPSLIQAVNTTGHKVVWCCDPMHGNTERAQSGYKTRRFDNVLGELLQAFDIHAEEGSLLGGVHFELTGEDVTECIGGASGINVDDLQRAYRTSVDPRLNAEQSLEMALRIVGKYDVLGQT